MAKKRRLLQRPKAAGPLGVIPVHSNDLNGPIYAVVLDPRSSKPSRGKTRSMKKKDKRVIVIVVGRGGRCVKHEFDEVIYWVCEGSLS